jgi:hypothetical protein
VRAAHALKAITFPTVRQSVLHRYPQIVIALGGLLTVAWVGLLIWISAGLIVELI